MTRILAHIPFSGTVVTVDVRPRAITWMDAAAQTGEKTPNPYALALRHAP